MGKKKKCKKSYSDEEKQQCKKTCDLCDAPPPPVPPPTPASFASLTASRASVSPNRRTSTPFASHLQLSAPAEQRSLIQAASRANARASGPRRPARAGLQWPSHEL